MDKPLDVTTVDDTLSDSNDVTTAEDPEPATKKRKTRSNHDDFYKYFDKIKEDDKVKFVCKLKKKDGTDCKKKYVGPTHSNAV